MHCDRPLPEVIRLAAELGWENLEFCSRDDFFLEYWPPRADKTRIREFKQALYETGMNLVSLLWTSTGTGPDPLSPQQDSRSSRLRVMRSTVLSRPRRPLAHSVHPVVNTVPPRL